MNSGRMLKSGVVALIAGSVVFAAAGMRPAQQDGKPAPAQDQRQEQRQDRQGQPGEGRGRGPFGQGTSIEGGMKGMGRVLRTLKDQVKDASKRDENLQLIGTMEVSCITAKGGKLDERLKDVTDEAKKTSMKKAFRADLIKLARTLLDVEQALLDEKYDDADAALKKVLEMREHGHEEFGVKED